MADSELADLRWHWGEAYLIQHPAPDVWIAQRRDNHFALRADEPAGLTRLIHADYAAHPVPRCGEAE